MRSLIYSLLCAGYLVVPRPCCAIDIPSSIPDMEALGQVTSDWPLSKDEQDHLARKMLRTTVPLTKTDLPSLKTLRDRILLGESMAKKNLKEVRGTQECVNPRAQDIRNKCKEAEKHKHRGPRCAQLYEDLQTDLRRLEQRLQRISQQETTALQELKDWQILSKIVARLILERQRAEDAAGPPKKK